MVKENSSSMGIDLFGMNAKETQFFLAIRKLSVDAQENGVKLKQLMVFYDDDGIAASLQCEGEFKKIWNLRKIIREE